MAWWHNDYLYRRKISIQAPPEDVPSGHPVTVVVGKVISTNSKVREDLQDLEVVYNDIDKLYREVVTLESGDFEISFNLQEDIAASATSLGKYYVYYGNPDLANAEALLTGSITQWPVSLLHSDDKIAYTRPGEHWEEGISVEEGARITFRIWGTRFRLISEVGPDKAIMEVQIDGGDWEDVDLFSPTAAEEAVYEKDGLSTAFEHEIRIRVSGRRNESSLGDEVNLKRVEYYKAIVNTDQGEEVTTLPWASITGGFDG